METGRLKQAETERQRQALELLKQDKQDEIEKWQASMERKTREQLASRKMVVRGSLDKEEGSMGALYGRGADKIVSDTGVNKDLTLY